MIPRASPPGDNKVRIISQPGKSPGKSCQLQPWVTPQKMALSTAQRQTVRGRLPGFALSSIGSR